MKDIISHKIHRIHGHKKEHQHVMLFLVLFHLLNAQKAKASQFSVLFAFAHQAKASPFSHLRFPFSPLRFDFVESAHAWHNSSELDSALA